MDDVRLILLVPLFRSIDSASTASLLQLVSEVSGTGRLTSMLLPVDTFLTTARNRLAMAAIDAYRDGIATHALWVDDDITIPHGGVERLISHDLPIVGGLYYCRDFKPCIFDTDKAEKWETAPGTGLVEADGTGFGCLLMRIEILVQLAEHFGDLAWCQMPHEGGGWAHVGEDVFFFRRVKELGIPVYVDCDVQCSHAITIGLNRDLVELVRTTEGYEAIDARRGSCNLK